jgi:hypothetical protein
MARYWQGNNGPYVDALSGGTELYGNWGGFGSQGRSLAATYTRTITPAVINEARFGFLQVRYYRGTQNPDLDPSTFIPGLTSPLPGLVGLPNVNLTQGYRGFSDVPGSGDRQRNYEFFDTVSWIRGRHTLKAGFEIQRASSYNFSNLLPSRGQFEFDGRIPVTRSRTCCLAIHGERSGPPRIRRSSRRTGDTPGSCRTTGSSMHT